MSDGIGTRNGAGQPVPLAFSVPSIRTSSRGGPGGPARLGTARSAVVAGAAAVPLTYFPILIVASGARLTGRRVNRRWPNAAGTSFLTIMVIVSLASWPLLLLAKGRPVREALP